MHLPSGVVAQAGERRSQHQNRDVAIERLRLKLATELRIPLEQEHGPSPLWRQRTIKGKVSVNVAHRDFPALLAEALDQISHHRLDMAASSACLGVSTSQLVKLLKQHPPAFQWLNQQRQAVGQHPLR
jgi:hypothetical protein